MVCLRCGAANFFAPSRARWCTALVRFDAAIGQVSTLDDFTRGEAWLGQVPGAGRANYSTFLRATRLMTRDQRKVDAAFQRCVFNVVFNHRDDHAKNFAYRMGCDWHWRLSPCYDLSFNSGPAGEHQMAVVGESKARGWQAMRRSARPCQVHKPRHRRQPRSNGVEVYLGS
jgi:hypothetical protein